MSQKRCFIYIVLFSTTSQLNGNFECQYLRRGTWHRQLVNGVGNYEGSPTSYQNFINFGPLTTKNRTGVFTRPPKIRRFSQLNGNFNCRYLQKETQCRQSALATWRDLLSHLKTTWCLVHKRLKIVPQFLPTLHKFDILLHCQGSQTEISKRNSTKVCKTADSKSH